MGPTSHAGRAPAYQRWILPTDKLHILCDDTASTGMSEYTLNKSAGLYDQTRDPYLAKASRSCPSASARGMHQGLVLLTRAFATPI